MTIGELARLFNEEFGIGADLQVVTMSGWTRDMYFDATGLPWVMPSPNMPTLETAIVYPGTVLLEGTNISEGRGTTRPFEIVGAPWPIAERLAEQMNAVGLAGSALPACGFRADVPEARKNHVRRLSDARSRSTRFQAGRSRRRPYQSVSRCRTRAVRVAPTALRVRKDEDADRHSRWVVRAAGGH